MSTGPAPRAALAIRDLGVTFGGVRAVADVSFTVAPGSLTALIGPNGAGKTTLFNLVTGVVRPLAGTVALFGAPILGLRAEAIAARGLLRTFQTARVFPGMTARENLLVGAHRGLRSGALAQMLRLPAARREERAEGARAEALLDLLGLLPCRDVPATELPMGAQKLLEVGRALMGRPRVLLLDEPAAGLNDTETAELAALLRGIRDAGVTVLIVEHNMALVMESADHVVVLDAGRLIAEGTPAAVRADPAVIEAYLGAPEPAAPAPRVA
jgi:branched-chain amino acid transport system ATP-binding protein